MHNNFEPYEALKLVSNKNEDIDFESIMMQKHHIALLNRIFENCDFSSLEDIKDRLIDFFDATKIYIRIIENPIDDKESEIMSYSLEKINAIAEEFYEQANI